MKKHLLLFTLLLFMGFTQLGWGQLLVENFSYADGALLTANGWTAHSGAGTQPITVTTGGGLTYADYAGSGIGNAAMVDNNGEDDNKTFTAQTSGTIYFSFLVRVDVISPGYFIHLMKNSTTYAARVFIQSSGSGFNFGISNTSTGIFGSTVYNIGTTYLCVVKYDFASSDVNLWVFSSGVPASEVAAGISEVSNTGNGQNSLGAIALRQYNASQNIVVDGIRVADSWDQAPLPVELTSFTANASAKSVTLNWVTATEVNNYGFEVERTIQNSKLKTQNWEKIGFVAGNGNSNSTKNYSYTDINVTAGKYSYRLKQIDNDGQYTYSKEVEVELGIPTTFSLEQNYPNPFNPTTSMQYSVSSKQFVTIKVFDMLGREVAVLVNGEKEPGTYTAEFSSAGLASGTYIYRMQAGAFVQTKKMILLK